MEATNDAWFMNGPTTGWTVGTLHTTNAHMFLRGTNFGVTNSDGIHPRIPQSDDIVFGRGSKLRYSRLGSRKIGDSDGSKSLSIEAAPDVDGQAVCARD